MANPLTKAMIKNKNSLSSGPPRYNKNDPFSQIKDSLQEISTKIMQEKETKQFNHFVETGKVLPEDKDSNRKSYLEVLGEITSIVRPGPLTPLTKKI